MGMPTRGNNATKTHMLRRARRLLGRFQFSLGRAHLLLDERLRGADGRGRAKRDLAVDEAHRRTALDCAKDER